MSKKRISKKALEQILNKMPKHIKQKLVQAIRDGKKININIKTKNNGIPSPYQPEK